MDEKEILWRYDRAQNQNQMITILHELTLIPEYQIMILIINSGRELPERKVTALKKRRITLDKAIAKKEADFAKFAKRMVDDVARLGYNIVRFHHYDGCLLRRAGGYMEMDAKKLDAMDYTFAQMKKRGRLLQSIQSADDAIRELEAEKRMITIVLKGGETKTWKTKDKTAQHT